MTPQQLAGRWRLVLGRFAAPHLGIDGADQARMDRVLDYLYNREYTERGLQVRTERQGGDQASVFDIPRWLREVRDLFPKDVCETITQHALSRYGLTEILTDPAILRTLEPSYDLLKTLLTFKDTMKGEALELARDIIRRTITELRERLANDVRRALWGRRDRNRRTRLKTARNLAFRATIRANLKHWDAKRRRLLARDLIFHSRVQRHMTWDVIIAVDCSGSMMDSVIHSAVMASIFAGLPTLRVRLVAFDTSVVDLSEHVDDAVAILMSVQLGGGTDIAGAIGYCAKLVEQPSRTIVVCVTDFMEGGSLAPLLGHIRALRSEGVRFLGLAALDARTEAVFDRDAAAACAAAGAEIGVMTPNRLAEWIGGIIHT